MVGALGGGEDSVVAAAEPKDEQVERLTRSLRNRYGKNLSEDDDAWKAADLIESQARQIATLTAERDQLQADQLHKAATIIRIAAERDRATKLYEDGMHGYERVCCERDRAVEALAWVMKTHVKDGAIIDPKHSATIKAAL